MNFKKYITIGLLSITTMFMVGCDQDDADVASYNISKAADNFEIKRRVVFYNGITDKYILEVVGYCSIDDDGEQLELTCLNNDRNIRKHFLGLSDNVTYFTEHISEDSVDMNRYRVTFKPETLLPNIDYRSSAENDVRPSDTDSETGVVK